MKVDPREVELHNEVTRTIIVGIMCDIAEGAKLGDIGTRIMQLLKDRGYEPQIQASGQLKNGTNV